MWHLKRLVDISDKLLKSFDALIVECDDATLSFKALQDLDPDSLVLYNSEVTFVLRINIYPKRKVAYLSDVCSSAKARGQGLFRSAIEYLKTVDLGVTKLSLDASMNSGTITQQKRIEIFSKLDFKVDKYADTWTRGVYKRVLVKTEMAGNTILGCYTRNGPIECPMSLLIA